MDTTADYTATESATLSTIDEMSENELQAVADFRKSLLSAENATGYSTSSLPVDEVDGYVCLRGENGLTWRKKSVAKTDTSDDAADHLQNEVFEVSVSDSKLETEPRVTVKPIGGPEKTSLEQDIDTILTSTRINSEKSDFEYSG